MISKEYMFRYVFHYRARYRHMVESDQVEDNANAEACLIGADAWEDIASRCMNPAFPDFRVEQVIENVQSEWDEYLKTGISKRERKPLVLEKIIDQIRSDFSFIKGMKLEPLAAPIQPETAKEAVRVDQTPEFDPETGRRRKKPHKPPETPIQAISEPEPVIEPPQLEVKINQLFIDTVSPRSIDEIINIIKAEFGVDRQEAEIAASISQIPSMTPTLVPNHGQFRSYE